MVLKRLSSFLLIAGSLWLSGCITPPSKIAANNTVNAPPTAAATQLGNARPGDVVDLPVGNVFGETVIVVGDNYTAASGRLCRRLRSNAGSVLSRIVCQRESGEWYSPRSLYSNNQQSVKESFQGASSLGEGESVDLNSIVVVELGDDDLQTSSATTSNTTVHTATTPVETSKQVLREGETLWSFSRRVTGNARNWNAIADINGIDDSRRLAAGDTLLVPKYLVRGEP